MREFPDTTYWRLLQEIDRLLAKQPSVTIAIDGKCGSGKTTLAQLIAEAYDCNVIHMDDFFLPPVLRTKERLAEPGGNVHYERFMEEVLLGLVSAKGFSHRFFDCRVMDYTIEKTFLPKALNIIEGSYSHRPEFAPFYHLKVFLGISEEIQKERILARNGKEKYADFVNRWIPMENDYFKKLEIEQNSDLVLCNDRV